jgi:hypothetical protein
VTGPRAAKLITCIVPQGAGAALLDALVARRVVRVALGTARASIPVETGRGRLRRTVYHPLTKDILTAVVDPDEADDVFAFIHEAAAIAERPGAFVFLGPLSAASAFELPSGVHR